MNRRQGKTNFKNSYIQKINRPLNSPYADLNLGECLDKHVAEEFIADPKAYLNRTQVTNFTIIYAEQAALKEAEAEAARNVSTRANCLTYAEEQNVISPTRAMDIE